MDNLSSIEQEAVQNIAEMIFVFDEQLCQTIMC